MKALNYLAVFPFDYLFDGYGIYIWIVLAAIVFVLVVVLVELRLLKPIWNRILNASRKETTPSTEPPGSSDLSSLKKSIDELKQQQENLAGRLSSVHNVLERMQVELARLKPNNDSHNPNYIPKHRDQDTYGRTPRSDEYVNVRSSSTSTPEYYSPDTDDGWAESCSDMTALYNASRNDQSSRARFREKYKPFFINVANDVDRRRNAAVPPDFRREADGGSYLAVPQETDEAAIFPNFTLVVVDAFYGPGALAEVFDCGTFDRRFSYPNIRVDRPATFKLTGGQSWRVTQKGKLDLGTGQDD